MGRSRSNPSHRGLAVVPDPAAEAAREAGLVYTTDDEPGLRRARKAKGFVYLGPDGRLIRDAATLDRLHETTFIRVGNEEYAKQNRSFGLTTLRNRHVDVKGSTVRFLFHGKSGVEVQVGITDRRVARVIKRCEELPGQKLFQYIDAEGEHRTVSSDDVNQYLRDVTGEDFTAKDFRTWAGTVLAASALREGAGFESETDAKRNVVAAIDQVARKLGHTRAVCRRSYVHPAVIDTYMDGRLETVLRAAASRVPARLKSDEAAVLALVRRKAKRNGSVLAA